MRYLNVILIISHKCRFLLGILALKKTASFQKQSHKKNYIEYFLKSQVRIIFIILNYFQNV